jgi:signal transduction histidine kinase
VTQNTAASTALYFDSFVAPVVQDLASGDSLPTEKSSALEKLIHETPIGQRVVSFKIWRRDGVIAFATDKDLIGKSFPQTAKLRRAWEGHIAADLDRLEEEENESERATGVPLLEVYVPIRAEHSARIIAVGEFYERADQLKEDIFTAKLESWLVIGAIALVAVSALIGIVGRGSRTIEQQRSELQNKIAELQALLKQNTDLRARVERASLRALEINEQHLRRLGAELHDGPAQLLGLALLRLDSIEHKPAGRNESNAAGPIRGDVETIRTALRDALQEIRNISVGLSLPALDRLSIGGTLQAAVRDHIRRTSTPVSTEISATSETASHPIKTAAFRFVQEALNNATRHADALGQKVRAYETDGFVVVEVSDKGKGFDPAGCAREDQLGLAGMRERINSLGGDFTMQSTLGGGTILTARLPLYSERMAGSA